MGERPAWGLAAQLYSVRSRQSWGVGDLADLTDLAVWSGAELGADYVLVNPLHAAEPVAPMEPSPYLPTSRRFLNPLYLRVERIPEYADLPPATGPRSRSCAPAGARRARRRRRDRPGRRLGRQAGGAAAGARGAAHRRPRGSTSAPSAAARGRASTDFATWCALAEVHGTDCREWPARAAAPGSPGGRRLRSRARRTPSTSTCGCSGCSTSSSQPPRPRPSPPGWRSGVMHDLAVGVHPGGADAWALQDVYAAGISVGAPPDAFNQIGQDWAQPPWRPDRLAELGYAPFRDAGRARCCGTPAGVRVDHIIGLFRLWWVPAGRPPTRGHLRPLRPRGADRHPRPGGAPRGRGRGRRGPRRRSSRRPATTCGSAGSSAPRSCGSSSDDDGRPLPAGALARAVPGVGDHPRPAADARATSPATTSGCATRSGCSPGRSTRSWPPTRPSARLAGRAARPRRAARRDGTPTSRRPCAALHALPDAAPRRGCSASR